MDCRVALAVVLLAGCGGVPRAALETPLTRVEPEPAGAEALEVAELAAHLADVEAENVALRAALSSAHRTATASCVEGDFDSDASGESPEVTDGGTRPVLRLYGAVPSERPSETPSERPALRTEGVVPLAGPDAPMVLAAPPPGALGRLLVTGDGIPAIPVSPIVVAPRSAASTPADDPAIGAYQAALRRVSERDLDGALTAFAAFLDAHPDHAYADNALYWRAEVFYARHDWSGAVRELEALLNRFPSGTKVPDALLRLGMCWERLGDASRARGYFEVLTREHPDTTAAHMASREDT